MTTPNHKEIVQKAIELWREDRLRSGDPSFDLLPEIEELQESGYLSAARSECMRDQAKAACSEWNSYNHAVEKEDQDVKTLSNSEKTEIPFDVNEVLKTGFFVSGTSQSGKTNLAKHLALKLMRNDIVVYVLDTSQAWLHNTPINNHVNVRRNKDRYEFMGSTVFDLSALNTRDRIKFTDGICRAVFQKHVNGYRQPEFFIFEEAQTYLPNGCLRISTRRKSACESVLDIVTVGANYNVRFGLVTQFPAMVDKAPVKITMQRYFGLTWEKNDVAYIKHFIGKENIHLLRDLKTGEFVFQYKGDIRKISTPEFGRPEVQDALWFNCRLSVNPVSLYRNV